MKLKHFAIWSALALLASATACTKASPTRPSDETASTASASVRDAVTGITLTSPTLVAPTANQQFKYADQPLTLTVGNAISTGSTAPTYTFEVASDAAFATKVFSKDGVAAGSGQTSLKIDTLPGPAAKSYFWRARISSGSLTGPYSAVRTFGVGAQVVIQAASLVGPQSGASVGVNGLLTVNNAAVTGPAGLLVYRFEVSDTAGFTNLLFVSSVNQTNGQTSTAMSAKLVTNGTYFWRVQVSDPTTGVTSPYSAVGTFKYQPFDLHQAIIVDSPPDLADWPVTTTINSIDFKSNGMNVDFSKRDGPGRWPDVPFGSPGDSLQYTLGMAMNINGQWYASAPMQFWYGLDHGGGNIGQPGQITNNWFYDSRWGNMQHYTPAVGETIALFVASGNLRDAGYTQASCPQVCERSNVVLIAMPDGAPFTLQFSQISASALRRR
jgi:hypothetical protein